MEREDIELRVDVWKKIVDVQMHFNELEMKIRNFAILVLSAFIGAIGLALKEGATFSRFGIPLAAFLSLACVFLCMVFYFVDRYWYHPLLLGAVKQGADAEAALAPYLPAIRLGARISEESALEVRFFKGPLRSSKKILIFYVALAFIFTLLTAALLWVQLPVTHLGASKSAANGACDAHIATFIKVDRRTTDERSVTGDRK